MAAQPLRGVNFALPGSYGLNTQSSIADDQAQRFASSASNGVIDRSGKLVSRQDFVQQTSGFTGNVEQVYTHRNSDGTETILSVAVGKVYSGTGTLTQRFDYSATSTTLNDVQFASLSAKIFGAQKGVVPFVLNESTFAAEAFTGAPWSSSPNVFVAASGRMWAADDETGGNRYTLWWSNLLDGKVWNAGDAGSLNLQKVWPGGQDSIIAVTVFQDRVVVFGRNNILLYTLPADRNPVNMSLTDTVSNLGCMARDSVLLAGGDLFFLSDTGVYKIPRLAQVTSLLAPVKVSKLVADDVVTTYAAETLTKVRAGYNPTEKWYVLGAPTGNKCWVFHLDKVVPDHDVPAVTNWTNVGIPFRAFCFDKSGNWYCGFQNGVGKYTGYTADGTSNVYTFDFYTQWNPLQDETRLKHLKGFAMTLSGVPAQTGTFRWLADYLEGTVRTLDFTLSSAEFAENPGIGVVKGQIGGTCSVGKFGFTMPVSGNKISFHELRVYARGGITKVR